MTKTVMVSIHADVPALEYDSEISDEEAIARVKEHPINHLDVIRYICDDIEVGGVAFQIDDYYIND